MDNLIEICRSHSQTLNLAEKLSKKVNSHKSLVKISFENKKDYFEGLKIIDE